MAAYSLCVEDEVCTYKPSRGYCFGLILENSEFVSSSEDDEDEADERVQQGSVKVAWHPTGKESIISESKVQLVDRSLMPGDVVRRLIPGQESQCGFVMDMDVRSHLRILRTYKYIYNVDSKDMQPIEKFESNQEVMIDSWLGRVENVVMDAVLVFADGAKCQVDINELYSFDEKSERHGKFSESLYYPGQELKGPLASLTEAKWLHSTTRHSHKAVTKKGKTPLVNITIEKIVTKQVEVLWIFRGYEKIETPDISVKPPPRIVEGSNLERLTVLDWFSHCSIQIGDRMFYRIKNDDILSSVAPSEGYDPKAALSKDCPFFVEPPPHNPKNTGSASDSVSIPSAKTDDTVDDDADYVDVEDELEEDSDFEEKQGAVGGKHPGGRGKKKHGMYKGGGAVGSPRHKHGGQHLKVATKRRTCPKDRVAKADEVVEVEVEFNTSFATIMWQDGSVEKDIPSRELFPVHHLDELEFFPGDYVIPSIDLPQEVDYGVLVKADHKERTCLVHWFKAYDVGKASEPTVVEQNAEMSVYDIKDHPDYKFRPGQSVVRVGGFESLDGDSSVTCQAVGQIFELDPNGHIVVKWANGTISQCFPQEVFIVSDENEDSDNESWETESDYDSDASGDTWETESETEVIGEEGAKGDSAVEDTSLKQLDGAAFCKHKQEITSLLARAESALDRLQRLLNGFDVNLSAPDCFLDILRIYRNCHDLDKILQLSFFSDPELQDLLAQAKLELNRDRVNRISRSLAQVFEQRSKNPLPMEGGNMGAVSVGGKTIRIGTVKNGKITEVNVQVPVDRENFAVEEKLDNVHVSESGEAAKCTSLHTVSKSECMQEKEREKKRPSDTSVAEVSTERKGAVPLNDCSATALNQAGDETNLAVDSCVTKAAKRTKSDECDDSGSEAKRSRDEYRTANQTAKDLCVKICHSLQLQISKIKEEVNRRSNRLISASGNSVKKSHKNKSTGCGGCEEEVAKDDKDVLPDGDAAGSEKIAESNENTCETASIEADNSVSDSLRVEPPDSMPHSIDEAGERIRDMASAPGVMVNGLHQTCEEGGDVPKPVNAIEANPGDEASCEESTSQASIISDDAQELGPCKGFEIYGEVVTFHKYISQESQPLNPRLFRNSIRKELKLFQSSLPDGIFVKGFENRLDLFSVMILGPKGTPYEDAVFLFDMMLPNDYPTSPPLLHYYSFCSDRLNPNLYEDGKVCVSLLGTWSGKGNEVWTSKSNLLQVLLSIQGLILVSEPYYNEAYYERQRGTQVGHENSRVYNEMAILKTVQSLTRMCHSLPELFKHEIYQYLKSHGPRMIARLRHWMSLSQQQRTQHNEVNGFTPVSKTRKLTVANNASETSCTSARQQAQPALLTSSHLNEAGDDAGPGGGGEGETAALHPADIHDESSCSSSSHHPFPRSSSVDFEEHDRKGTSQNPKSHTQPVAGEKCSGLPSCRNDGSSVDAVSGAAPSLPEYLTSLSDIVEGDPGSSQSEQKEGAYISSNSTDSDPKSPEFPLFPMSRGFCLTLQKYLDLYELALQKVEDPAVNHQQSYTSDPAQEKEIVDSAPSLFEKECAED